MTTPTDQRLASKPEEEAVWYDQHYASANFYKYKPWIYRPFVKALVKRAGLKANSHLLDAGCGQGFFTSLFAECGLKTLGVDVSPIGIAEARLKHGSHSEFAVGDVLNMRQHDGFFDCVYSRSCSLYNQPNFAEDRQVSDALLRYIKPGGILIFDYYTRPFEQDTKSAWIYHTMASARKHFSPYPGAKVFFSLRIDTLVLGSLSFSLSSLNLLASRVTGVGGELVAFVPKN